MQWGSVENFLNMGGYAFYVWGSYIVCALVIAIELMSTRARRRRAEAEVRRIATLSMQRRSA
jgi:heme exporter protein D